MKHLFQITLFLAAALPFAACGDDDDAAATGDAGDTADSGASETCPAVPGSKLDGPWSCTFEVLNPACFPIQNDAVDYGVGFTFKWEGGVVTVQSYSWDMLQLQFTSMTGNMKEDGTVTLTGSGSREVIAGCTIQDQMTMNVRVGDGCLAGDFAHAMTAPNNASCVTYQTCSDSWVFTCTPATGPAANG